MASKFDNCRSLVVAVLSAAIALATVAFDGVLLAQGKAFEWIDAPLDCDGDVLVDSDAPPGMRLQPIAGVHVKFKAAVPRMHTMEKVITDDDGHFSAGRTVPAGTYDVVVVAEKEGYRTVSRSFSFGGGDPKHMISIVMVRVTPPPATSPLPNLPDEGKTQREV